MADEEVKTKRKRVFKEPKQGGRVMSILRGGTWKARLFRLILISLIMSWIGSYGGLNDKFPMIFGFFNGVLAVANFILRWFITLIRDIFTLKFIHPFTTLGTEVPKLIQQFIDWINQVAFI